MTSKKEWMTEFEDYESDSSISKAARDRRMQICLWSFAVQMYNLKMKPSMLTDPLDIFLPVVKRYRHPARRGTATKPRCLESLLFFLDVDLSVVIPKDYKERSGVGAKENGLCV